MSSGVNSDRSGIWSYVPFGSSPRRRSVGSSLPRPQMGRDRDNTPWDPFEKSGRQAGEPSFMERAQNAVMSQNRQGKALRMGGVAAIILFLYFFVFSGTTTSSISSIAGGKNVYSSANSPTTKCTHPHDSAKPLVQYAIMIDAGSTGSRIHVYKFNNCGSTPELENEEFKMTEKREGGSGLSSYKTDAEGAAMSLDPLLKVAMDTIPDDYKPCSPIAVKATAGLRLLGDEMSAKILDAVRHRLETAYPFPVVSAEKGGVEIMPGEMEGVYAWITTNYLLGKIGGPDKSPTAAIFDLGGGSTQVVFQPTFPDSPGGGMPSVSQMEEGDHKYSLNFGGRSFELYQHSHLGYGLMSARKALHTLVLENAANQNPTSLSFLNEPIPNPCIAPNASRRVDLTFPSTHPLKGDHSVTMYGPTDSLPAQCRSLTEQLLHKDAKCNLAPCSFNGVHQPPLAKTFAREDVYIFSYFYDRTKDLGMPDSFTVRELHDLTHKVCSGSATWESTFDKAAIKELEDRPEWCLDLNFMLALLHTGYELPIEREVKIAKKIAGNELGWCLGASLPLLEANSGWSCRLKEVS
ncbi:Guanosine-diphosphatase [Exophiala xenobiotica]|uniref:guanosine-diphosphatase n=1 Tax=Lithohypha guttulata TaxID=1690604 RepID=A0ABR0JZI4_9EURO|nr:Guanosine-diphosphatase [Lithohypha guttulata]KAK5311208.1 Guanosine-diphosphatase [Exophiala xenobiotica]